MWRRGEPPLDTQPRATNDRRGLYGTYSTREELKSGRDVGTWVLPCLVHAGWGCAHHTARTGTPEFECPRMAPELAQQRSAEPARDVNAAMETGLVLGQRATGPDFLFRAKEGVLAEVGLVGQLQVRASSLLQSRRV